jgi:hypothetical protein
MKKVSSLFHYRFMLHRYIQPEIMADAKEVAGDHFTVFIEIE